MKVLILEDNEERCEWFREQFAMADVVHITKYTGTAIRALERQEYNYIFLDHDLLPAHYVKESFCDQTTGLCIAKYLGENPEVSPKAEIIIHSMNYGGGKRMQEALTKGGRESKVVFYDQLQKLMKVNF